MGHGGSFLRLDHVLDYVNYVMKELISYGIFMYFFVPYLLIKGICG